MRIIDITEAQSWKQTLIDVAQTIQDKAAINGKLSEWDERVYNEVVEIEKKLDLVEPEIPMKDEDVLDLKQYVTNLLYAAYSDGVNNVKSPQFDKWVNQMTEQLDMYYAQFISKRRYR